MAPTGLVLLLFVLIVRLFSTVTAHAECNDNNGKIGQCIVIQDCPELYSLSKNDPLTEEDRHTLSILRCGYKGLIPKVCCVSLSNDDGITDEQQASITEYPWNTFLFNKNIKPKPNKISHTQISLKIVENNTIE